MVGKWTAIVSGTEIDCERSDSINNGYMCTFKSYQVPVTWEADVFTWNYGSVTGTITIEGDGYTPRMTWSTGSVWRKNVGKFRWIYDGFGVCNMNQLNVFTRCIHTNEILNSRSSAT